MSRCSLAVAAPLRFFLPASKRSADLRLSVDDTSTLGHMLAALGVPKTEVGALIVNGRPVDIAYRPRTGDHISILALAWPQWLPTSPPRFLLDVHLGTLSRRMRLLGLDTAYGQDAGDEALLETSLTQQRVLLTRDRGLLHRRALRWGAHINSQVPDEQLREVLDRFTPPLQPWSRCLACNGMLIDVPKTDVHAQLQDGTRRCYETFRRCERCGHIYWRGAHGQRLQGIVDAATARQSSAAGSSPSCPTHP
ncbi:MAG TPA: Mut7-C RNAse domain-containing protein [Nocardioidaceae bacterium]|nr:Mut7-C RNAse domain-containing protein [Nocardioidaceae bacterium]